MNRRLTLREGLNLILGGILVGVLVAVLAVIILPRGFGWRFLTVLTPSMTPALQVGGIVAVQPIESAKVEVGDVVVYLPPDGAGIMVSHRVVAIVRDGGRRGFRTRGDANNVADSYTVPADNLVGIVRLHVPVVGYAIAFLRTPLGLLTALLMPGLVLMSVEMFAVVPAGRAGRLREPAGPPY